MDPVPYEVREQDVDEVLNAYRADWTPAEREQARAHVMRHVMDIDEIARTAPEEEIEDLRTAERRAGPLSARPGDREPQRRELALGAIEDLLIRDEYVEPDEGEARVWPTGADRDARRDQRRTR